VVENLVRAARRKPAPVAWALKKSLPFWLVTVLNNSAFKCVKTGAALIKPGARVLVFSYSSTVINAILMARDKLPEILIPKDGHSMRSGQVLQREGMRVRVVDVNEPFDADLMLIGCDSFDRQGNIINARGTSKVLDAVRGRKLPVYCLTTWLKESRQTLRAPRNRAFEKVNVRGKAKLVGDL
jgi:hypothetical protein